MRRFTIKELQNMRESEDHVEFKRGDRGNISYNGAHKDTPKDRRRCIFISNNSFYLLQLKGCHKQHLIAIYVFFIEEAIDARIVWKNIGKKMGRDGAALTIA